MVTSFLPVVVTEITVAVKMSMHFLDGLQIRKYLDFPEEPGYFLLVKLRQKYWRVQKK